jgi:hypothetical protein
MVRSTEVPVSALTVTRAGGSKISTATLTLELQESIRREMSHVSEP